MGNYSLDTKPDQRQWYPFTGPVLAYRDWREGLPTIFDPEIRVQKTGARSATMVLDTTRSLIALGYHAIFTFAPLAIATKEGLEALVK